jgi:hypothetical protein
MSRTGLSGFFPLLPELVLSRLRDERQVGPRSMPPERGPLAFWAWRLTAQAVPGRSPSPPPIKHTEVGGREGERAGTVNSATLAQRDFPDYIPAR